MNFEDIVDMEWVDTHTILEDPTEFSSEFFFDHQPDYMLEQPLTPPQQSATIEPEIKMEPISSMPTTEQIKQLIEIAKRQLALREQNYLQQQQSVEQPSLFQPLVDAAGTAPAPITAAVADTEMDTAAPSNFFSMPPIPALSPTTVSTSEFTAIENATTLETISKQMNAAALAAAAGSNADIEVDDKSSSLSVDKDNAIPNAANNRRDSLASMPEESISLEAYAEQDGIDLKKLTPKERRQLRNKLSARNFRVRRKEYISTLEGQVNDHKMAAEALKEKLVVVEEENKKLRKEMDVLKRQNQQLLQQQQQQQQQQQKSPRPSPLSKPNLNKDISIMGTKATDSYRQDNCILVSNAVMPVWDYDAILKPKQSFKNNEYMNHLVGQFLSSFVQLASYMPRGTNQQEEYRLPLMPDDRDFTCSESTIKSTTMSISPYSSTSSSSLSSTSSAFAYPTTKKSSSSYIEDLYDVLIQSALINGSNTDKSFWWWGNNNSQTL